MTHYNPKLTCINGSASSTTVVPGNVATTSYSFGALQFGDAIQCTFSNTPYPHLTLTKALGALGRRFNTDQFTLSMALAAGPSIAGTTTTGTGTTVTNGSTAQTQVTAGTAYALSEAASGSTDLSQYTSAISCTNGSLTSSTALPTSVPGAITPVLGDVITCTITNTAKAANATLTITKSATLVSDPVNGATNPKYIPGAVVRYSITVANTGTLAVDASTIVVADPLPTTVTYNAASPVQFTNGAVTSGLNPFNAATMVTFSSQPGGGAPFTYAPNTGGYDANVKGVRIAPTGTMAGATAAGNPSFTVSFLTRVN
jgi:uncharacterized repeat protein (TIGR01451 family)